MLLGAQLKNILCVLVGYESLQMCSYDIASELTSRMLRTHFLRALLLVLSGFCLNGVGAIDFTFIGPDSLLLEVDVFI